MLKTTHGSARKTNMEMFRIRSIGIAIILVACATSFGAGAPPSGDPAAWVDQKVSDSSPKPEERRFDQTGWLTDIRSALDLAKKHNRPVFLFTHDGRMGLGRC